MRLIREIRISCDDTIPISITYPTEMSREEFEDLRDIVAIWLRQVERQVGKSILCQMGAEPRAQEEGRC